MEGHGDVLTKEDVEKRLTDAETKRAKIKEMVGLGRSLDYIRMALGEPEPAATPGRDEASRRLLPWFIRN